MWCREGVRSESSGMLLARSPSGWDWLRRFDFKREKLAIMSPAEAAASREGNISSSVSPFCGVGKNTRGHWEVFTQLRQQLSSSRWTKTHSWLVSNYFLFVSSFGFTTTNMFITGVWSRNRTVFKLSGCVCLLAAKAGKTNRFGCL